MSFDNGRAYNNPLMPIMRGDIQPDAGRAVEVMMWEMWESMGACDRVLAELTLEDTFVFMRCVTPDHMS